MNAARGTAFLMAAEAVFVLSGWAIHLGSKQVLGLEAYGILGILLSLLTHYRIFLATGVNRAVSRYIAQDPGFYQAIRSKGLKLQIGLGFFLGALVWLLAPVLSKLWSDLGNPQLENYIRLTGLFLPVFGIYSVFRGTLNGFRFFEKEAFISICYSLLKVAALFALIWRFGIAGAIIGYLVAISTATFMAARACPQPVSGPEFPVTKLIKFAIPVVSFSFLLSMLLSIDLYFVGAKAPAAGISAGYYTCAQQFARIPYMLLYALGLTLFPNIAAWSHNLERARSILSKGLRWGAILALPTACLISANAPNLIGWVYGSDAIGGGAPLRILVFGQTAAALFYLMIIILSAGGNPWKACGLVGIALILDIGLNLALVGSYGVTGAAWATTLSSLAGLIGGALLIKRRFGGLISPLNGLRIVLGSALTYGVSLLLEPEGWWLLPVIALSAVSGFILLLALGEIDRHDAKMLVSVFKRKQRKPL